MSNGNAAWQFNPLRTAPPSLNLSPDYKYKQWDPVFAWLSRHPAILTSMPTNEVVRQIKADVPGLIFPDSEISGVVEEYKKVHGLGQPVGPSNYTLQLNRFVAALASLPGTVKVKFGRGSLNVSLAGAIVDLRTRLLNISVKGDWSGVELKTEYRGYEFSVKASSEGWRLELNFGKDAPNFQNLKTVYEKGVSAVVGVFGQANTLDLRNLPDVYRQLKPYMDPIKDSIEASTKIAGLKAGDIGFSLWLNGPGKSEADDPLPPSQGVSAGAMVTIVF